MFGIRLNGPLALPPAAQIQPTEAASAAVKRNGRSVSRRQRVRGRARVLLVIKLIYESRNGITRG